TRIEGSEPAHHRIFERNLGFRRIAIDALSAREHRGSRKAEKNRLREVRMTDHQLALGQRGQLGLDGRRENAVPRGREFVGIESAVDRGTRIAYDPLVDLGSELLRRKENQAQIAASLRE